MEILWAIIIGGFAGWIAEQVMKTNHGLLTNIICGVVGSFVGWWIVGLIGITILPGLISNIIVASLGAMLVIFVYQKIKGR